MTGSLEDLGLARRRAKEVLADATGAVREGCLAAIATGAEKQVVAERAGISRVTLNKWLEQRAAAADASR